MSERGHARQFGHAPGMSALPPIATEMVIHALLQKPRIDVVGALATIGLLEHHRDELVLVGSARISHVASFGHADRHQRKFLAV